MRVLVACECSGIVREAFRALGHDAWSCDLKPSEDDSPFHIQGDAIKAAYTPGWDLMVAHPECRYLCNSGVLRLYLGGKKVNGKDPDRWRHMEAAAQFFLKLMQAPIPKIAIENSVMHGHAKGYLASEIMGVWKQQTIQPYCFGEDASKRTLLLLKGLPKLRETQYVEPRWVDGRPRWANQTDGGQNRLGPSLDRPTIRARTYPGIAKAFAEQFTAHNATANVPAASEAQER